MAWWNNNAAPNSAPPAAVAAQPELQPSRERMMVLLNEAKQARQTARALPRGNAQRRTLIKKARRLENEAAWHAAHGGPNISNAYSAFFANNPVQQQNGNEDPSAPNGNGNGNAAAGNPTAHTRRGGTRKGNAVSRKNRKNRKNRRNTRRKN